MGIDKIQGKLWVILSFVYLDIEDFLKVQFKIHHNDVKQTHDLTWAQTVNKSDPIL